MNRPFDIVTGGAGFIGSHLCEALLRQGRKVRIIDDFSTGTRENIQDALLESPEGLEVFEMDILDQPGMVGVMQGAERVFHLAAMTSVEESVQRPDRVNAINVAGTVSVLMAARNAHVRRLVFASSTAVYGNSTELPKRETMMAEPASPYALTKLAGELYCRIFSELYGLETVSLRFFNVFGPRQDPKSPYSAVIPRFLDRILQGKPPIVYGDGEQTRDFVYVDDVVSANLQGAESGSSGLVLNVASGVSHSLNRLLQEILAISRSNLAPLFEPPRMGEVRHSTADITRAAEAIGYRPAVPLGEGLRRTYDWYRRQLQE